MFWEIRGHSGPNIPTPNRSWFFFKLTSPKPAETNALITTRSGHEVSLNLASEGDSNRGGSIDFVLKYERPRSFVIGAAYSSFAIAETKALGPESVPATNARSKAAMTNRSCSDNKDSMLLIGKESSCRLPWDGCRRAVRK